ncbi:hypothetical protein MHM95_05885 [Pseudoalteromonas sp. CnMc7-15]|uniref:PKD domain-containing protein n=1 Tax=unclassified Pseudoalteromonas TaxID=194690 RepID=UPI001EF66831|nr:hypothetical protein [Pseudoalteromonas sp. CnMc7-15]MCG7565816.1 hypothetical protein [Pseudoalteromonas sp. CnMc7-15]
MKFYSFLSLLIVFLISGCGGSNDKEEPTNNPPVITVSYQPLVNERSTVFLSVIARDDESIESYLWKQKSGLPVTLTNPNQENASFKAPSLSLLQGVQKLAFEVLVTDGEGAVASADLVVEVQPISRKPVVTVTEEINGKSGAFTMLTWDVDGEPIADISLTTDYQEEFNIKLIDNNKAEFNFPKAFSETVSTNLNLTIEDEDGNSTSKVIKVESSPVVNFLSEPELIYEADHKIVDLSDDFSSLIYYDDSYNLRSLKYHNGMLIENVDFDFSTVINFSLFYDVNNDGLVDALSDYKDYDSAKGYCMPDEWKSVIIVNYGYQGGFMGPEVIADLGCEGYPESTTLMDVKDINDDGYADLKTTGIWSLYNELKNSYEPDDLYDSSWVRLNTDASSTEVEKVLFDIDSDSNTDIVQISGAEICPEYDRYDYFVCGTLSWRKQLADNSYASPKELDNQLGSYSNFRLLDVDNDESQELVVDLSSPIQTNSSSRVLDTKARWYEVKEDGIAEANDFERISHFIDLYGTQSPYFFDININEGLLTHYEYNELLKRPVITAVIKLSTLDTEVRSSLLTDIDQDGDLDILISINNKIYLSENNYH